jgi:hypothetical protein
MELKLIIDAAHCLYYANVQDPTFHDPYMLASLNTKAMESVRKEHMTAFHKQLPICDLALGAEFLQQI